MKPSIGRIVHYVLDEMDVQRINAHQRIGGNTGNPHAVGQHVPMVVIVVWPNEFGPDVDGVNGQVLLDGNYSHWVTSVKEGTVPRTWHWPERVED